MSTLMDIARRAAARARERKASLTPEDVLRMPLSEFAQAGLVVAVRFPLLDEPVYLASDDATLSLDERGRHQGRPVFRAREWRRLLDLVQQGMDANGLRLLLEAKAVFGGELLPAEPA